MRRDVIGDRYGRFWQIPLALAEAGHDISCISAAYYRTLEPYDAVIPLQRAAGTLRWQSFPVSPYSFLGWKRYLDFLTAQADRYAPDCIIAASDAFQLILGAIVAQRIHVPFVADFYDNFESFGATRVPGVRQLLRRATRRASLVSCVSEPLRSKLIGDCGLTQRVVVIENGVDPSFYSTLRKTTARKLIGLPEQGRLIGTAGALSRSRGVHTLFQAFERLVSADDQVYLVLAGSLDTRLPRHSNVLYLGDLPHDKVPTVLRALDVGIICLRNDAFGRYCYPQKAAEMAAAGLPMVFPAIGSMATGIAAAWGEQVKIGCSHAMADGIRRQLDSPRAPSHRPRTWRELAANLCDELSNVI